MNKELKDYYSVERWGGLFKMKDRWCYLPTPEDCLGVNKTILETLSLYKTELGAFKKALIQASKLKTRSGSFKTCSCPQFVAKCFASEHINIFPHYIYCYSWVNMTFATVSSIQPVTKVLNTPPLLVGSQTFCSFPPTFLHLQKDFKQQIVSCPGISPTGFRLGINHLWADFIDCRHRFFKIFQSGC